MVRKVAIEEPILYSSIVLVVMGCLSLALFLIFRFKIRVFRSLPDNSSAEVFHRTFNVLDPYPKRSKLIHQLLTLLPFFVFVASAAFTFLLIEAFLSGLVLSLIIVIICLNLIIIDELFEVYKTANVFIKAINEEVDFGMGDVRILQVIKKALPKACNYYLSLTISFMFFALALPYVMNPTLWLFSYFIGVILAISAQASFLAPLIAVLLLALITVLTQIFVRKAKSKFLNNLIVETAVSREKRSS